MLVDSHCHLNYLDDPDAALERARERHISACLCIGVEEKAIDDVLGFAAAHADVWASVGEHPGSCSGDASWVAERLDAPRVVAVGEMGLDYHYETNSDKQALQRQTFEQQLEIAAAADLPVIIHTRAAEADTLALLERFPTVRGVLHCFTESWDMARHAIDLGYYISISGIVTFKNAANVRYVAERVPTERLLIETDAPWLAPVPHRGAQNEPGFVADTAAFLANLRQVTVAELAQRTSENFFTLFNAAAR